MKICCFCFEEKDLNDFTKRHDSSDGHNSRCKICTRLWTQKHYKENKKYYISKARTNDKKYYLKIKAYLNSLKEGPCLDCKKKFPTCCMDFDHLRDKKFNISQFKKSTHTKLEDLKTEIDKCEVVCSNCHRIRTETRRKNKSALVA